MSFNLRTLASRLVVPLCLIALAILASIGASQTASAHTLNSQQPANPTLTCSWMLIPGTTWDRLSVEHHFDVEYRGLGDMTALVTKGQARILFQGQVINLSPWSTNKWGVHTTWVAQHPVSFWSSQNWQVQWQNGAGGISCPLA